MTAASGPDDRDLVPRWRPFGAALRSGELESARAVPPAREVEADLAEAAAAFRRYPGLHTAGDLLGQALVQRVQDALVREAARYVVESESPSSAVRALAERTLSPEGPEVAKLTAPESFDHPHAVQRVSRLRAIVHREPRNAIRWADLALAHLNLGAIDAARREILVAATLSPMNRYILRSAARLFVLLGDPERAHDLLTRDTDALLDPWIHAAELAVSQMSGRQSRGVRRAREMVEGRNFPPWHISELAGELATAELRAGRTRQANRHMRQALVDPTENALAQAEWATKHGVHALNAERPANPLAFEARALAHAADQRYEEAALEGARWLADQPFAPEPAIFTSYIASVGAEDYVAGVEAARRGLVANPEDVTLRNNLVFSLASAGRVAEARHELSRVGRPRDQREAATLLATQGLVAFREGRVNEGRASYSAAVESLARKRDRERAALAAVFWAREEILAGSEKAAVAVLAAQAAAKEATSPEVRMWVERLKRFSHPAAGPVQRS